MLVRMVGTLILTAIGVTMGCDIRDACIRAIAYSVSLRAGQLSSLVTWIVIGAIPGTRGVNRFGPDPTMPLQQESEPNDVPAA